MAVIDNEGNGWVKDREGKVILFCTADNRVTDEGKRAAYQRDTGGEQTRLSQFRCLVEGGTYAEHLQQLYDHYTRAFVLVSTSENHQHLERILHDSDALRRKLVRGFVDDEERGIFQWYTSQHRQEIVDKLKTE